MKSEVTSSKRQHTESPNFETIKSDSEENATVTLKMFGR